MRCFFACVLKDVRLFFSRKAAALVLALPILLLAVLIPGFGETTSARTYVRPFRFVICDLDDSVMSRSLINQLRQFELFEEIASVQEKAESAEWFDRGYAAYAMIPKNFFYAMYDMDNLPVKVEFNPDMPAEAAIIETVFRSVTDIVAAEQQARIAEYRVRAAAGFDADKNELFYESANYELRRALSRRTVFSEFRLIEDYTENSLQAAYATVTAMLCMLIPLCVLRGLPEELSTGIVDRLKSSGRGFNTLIFSKFFAALILFALPFSVTAAALRTALPIFACLSALLLFTLSFSLFGIVSISTPDASKAQLIGNMSIVLFLLFGGAIYPYQMLPRFAQRIACASPVYYYLRGINGIQTAVLILAVSALLFSVLFLVVCRSPLRFVSGFSIRKSSLKIREEEKAASTGKADIICVVWHKMLAMTGRRVMLVIMLAVSLICFYTVDRILDGRTENKIVIAVADNDGTDVSFEYRKTLASEDSVRVISCTESEALKKLDAGETEAVVIIGNGFEKEFLKDGPLPLSFYSSAAGAASDAGREICAGKLLSMQSSADAVSRLISDGILTEDQENLFYEQLLKAENEANPIVEFGKQAAKTGTGETVYGRIYARYAGFSALIIFLFLMSLSVLLSGMPSRAVRKAMSAIRGGYALYVLTDYCALVLAGALLASEAVVIRNSAGFGEMLAYFLYVNCVAGLCLLVSLTRAGGGSDMTATILAMVTGTVGGCFFDLSNLGGLFKTISYFTPQGLLIGALSGSFVCFIAMAAVSVICIAAYYAADGRV